MPRGRATRVLTKSQIDRLHKFRLASGPEAPHGYSWAQLRHVMSAKFGWRTLEKALKGKPVWDLHHLYIVEWIDRYLAPAAPLFDGKAAAAGQDRETEPPEASDVEPAEIASPGANAEDSNPIKRGSR